MACAGPTIAVLGGGQLGRMLGLAGTPLGCRFRFLDPSPDAPAGSTGALVTAGLDDLRAAAALVEGATVATYEWEGVPAGTARSLEGSVEVLPPPASLDVSQDRLAEKQLFERLGIRTAPYAAVEDLDGLRDAVASLGVPAILKTRTGGYDGRGQVAIDATADVEPAWEQLGGTALLVEARVRFARELSVLACRDRGGTTAVWPVVENVHEGGILRLSRAPAAVSDAIRAEAERLAGSVMDALDYVGVLCVELFDVDGELLANELAPRVHNSGHWTIEGAETSQFENHVRAVVGWPLGSTEARGYSAMVNCIGSMPDRAAVLAVAGAHLHDYEKAARPDRKVGHVTVTAPDPATLEERLARVMTAMGLSPRR